MTEDGVSSEGLRYETVGMSLRAPRVAVVFDGGTGWHARAREAMRQVTECWGGVGFVLVPHHEGTIAPPVASAVQRYDPDFVLTVQEEWGEGGATGSEGPRDGSDDVPTDGADAGFEAVSPPDTAGNGRRARDWLSEHCSPYVRLSSEPDESEIGWPTGEDGYRDECETSLQPGENSQLWQLDRVGVTIEPCQAVPRSWGGSVATAAAAMFGVLDKPALHATSTDDDAAVLGHLLGVGHAAPPPALVHNPHGMLLSVGPARLPAALRFSRHGLDLTFRAGHGRRGTTTWVVGSSSDDFALAMIWDRTHGQCTWIDRAWGGDPSRGGVGDVVRAAAKQALMSRGRPTKLVLMSATLGPDDLEMWQRTSGIDATQGEVIIEEPARRDDPFRTPLFQYVLRGQHDRRHALPLVAEGEGTVKLASTPPLPTVEPGHPIDTVHVPVQVDLVVPGATMPAGRGFDAHALADGDENSDMTWYRSSRSGVTYQSQRWDLVLSSATGYGRLAAPRLRVLGLQPWIRTMAQQRGYLMRSSDPGRRTDVLAHLWGGREVMARDVASPLGKALGHFTPPKGSSGSYLEKEAVKLTPERGVVTFEGMSSCWPDEHSSDQSHVRRVIDDLLIKGVLRRGLVLRCSACSRLDFFSIDQLAQRMPCALCGAQISLVQSNWRHPIAEPKWFYDAHPTARQLVSEHSDLPLILAHHLTHRSRRAWHVGELELVEEGNSVAETDLVAFVDGQLIIAEVKSNNDLAAGGSLRRAVDKRIIVAQVIRADQIVLATSKATPFSNATVRALKEGIEKAEWIGRPPAVRLISDLTTSTPRDEIV